MDLSSASEITVDARGATGGLDATSLVGGIPLVVRPLRYAARAGYLTAHVIVADQEQAAGIERALARYPVAASLAVTVTVHSADTGTEGAPREGVVVNAFAIYERDAIATAKASGESPAAVLVIASRADRAAAERLLYRQIRKSMAGDGVFAYYLIRPMVRPLSRALLGTRVTPNQVTVAALVTGLLAAVFAARGSYGAGAIAGCLYWLGNALDCIDGDLARLRLQSSKAGEWLDSMTDEISTFSLLAGLGIGLHRGGMGEEWLWIGVGGSIIGAAAVARLYLDLHNQRLPIDTAQFPWFFATDTAPAAAPAATTTPAAARPSLVSAFGYLIRRDSNVTGVALLCLFNLRHVATALVALGALAGAVVTVVHYVVMARRRARAV